MSHRDRRNAIVVAVIAAIATVAGALISSGWKQQSPTAQPAEQPRVENKAETKGDGSPAVAGAKDVTITYGEKPAKRKSQRPQQ